MKILFVDTADGFRATHGHHVAPNQMHAQWAACVREHSAAEVDVLDCKVWRRVIKQWIATILLIFIFHVPAVAKDLTVAAAANLQVLMNELVSAFEKESGASVDVVIGSSGRLMAQIENGAPFDVFMSADMSYPEALFKKGLALEKPKVYVYGLLVFWTSKPLDLSRPPARPWRILR
jgi:ABC-type molybdate transport system substrate-binding protein